MIFWIRKQYNLSDYSWEYLATFCIGSPFCIFTIVSMYNGSNTSLKECHFSRNGSERES